MASTLRYYLRRRSLIIQRLGAKCQNCSSTMFLEVHHIEEIRASKEGGWKRLLSLEKMIANGEIGNLKLLCKTCHIQYHSQQIFIYGSYKENGRVKV